MSAGSLPYHLRPNKAVDRLLFIELLSKLDPFLAIDSAYRYVGFGGPQMEDFRLLHERFPKLQMFCIEYLDSVIKRQRFNRPHTNVRVSEEPMKSGDWLNEWNPEGPTIVWFDYAAKADRPEQFREFQNLLRVAPNGSVLRITMNADLPKAEDRDPTRQYQHLKEKFPKLLPPGLGPNDISAKGFPAILVAMFKMAADDVLTLAQRRQFQPLLVTTYRDSNQMLTLAGIVGTREECKEIVEKQVIRDWKYISPDWETIQRINMPDLTVKERIHINAMLPAAIDAPESIHAALDCWVDEEEATSLTKIENYAEFYRHFPQFVRAAV